MIPRTICIRNHQCGSPQETGIRIIGQQIGECLLCCGIEIDGTVVSTLIMRHISSGICQRWNSTGKHRLQKVCSECNIGINQLWRLLSAVRPCIVGRQVIHQVWLYSLYRAVNAFIGPINRDQAEHILKICDILPAERFPDQPADLVICQQSLCQAGTNIAGDTSNQDRFHLLPSLDNAPYRSTNSERNGRPASLSDKTSCSTRSSGQRTASCGSSQRMPPSDSGSYRSPQR